MSHFAVNLKLTQYCKSTLLQFFFFFFKKRKPVLAHLTDSVDSGPLLQKEGSRKAGILWRNCS